MLNADVFVSAHQSCINPNTVEKTHSFCFLVGFAMFNENNSVVSFGQLTSDNGPSASGNYPYCICSVVCTHEIDGFKIHSEQR